MRGNIIYQVNIPKRDVFFRGDGYVTSLVNRGAESTKQLNFARQAIIEKAAAAAAAMK